MRECPACGRLFPDAEAVCPDDGRELQQPEAPDPYLGSTVGSYTLVRRLGAGSMGTVYLGRHPRIGSHVAVKIINPELAVDRSALDRFFNEARAVNLIGHPNLVQIFDFGQLPDGVPYFVMEHLIGHALSHETSAPLPIPRAVAIVQQIAAALQAAHDAGVVHRDLKPDNVFVVTPGDGAVRVKVLDFGIAKLSLPGPAATATGAVLGTAAYISPEQAAGDGARVGPASDVYSLGVILYQLVSGRLPFDAPRFAELLVAHMNATPPSLPASVPGAVAAITLRCLEKDPTHRFASMRELQSALSDLPAAHPSRRPTRWWPAAAAVAFAAMSALAYGFHASAPPVVSGTEPPRAPLPVPVAAAPARTEPPPPPSPSPTAPVASPTSTPPKAKRAKTTKTTIPEHVGDGFVDVVL